MAPAFGMEVIGWSRTRRSVEGASLTWVELDELFRASDVVTLHVPLQAETAAIVNRRTLSLMKPTAYLINTARGGLVVDDELAAALSGESIAGAALDVVGVEEPPDASNPLFAAPNCIITPHIAWATREARQRCLKEAARNLRAFLDGRERNRLV